MPTFRPLTEIPISLLTANSTQASGYVLRAYLTGTTTPTALYADENGTPAGTSVTLDARGEPTTIKRIWIDTAVNYKTRYETAAGVEVWTVDPVYGSPRGDASDMAVTATGTSVPRPLDDRFSDIISVLDNVPQQYRAGIRSRAYTYDAGPVINQTIAAMDGGIVWLARGGWRHNGKISCNKSNVTIRGDGTDATFLKPYNITTTALEVNNGSWNDSTKVYSSTGTSIGSTRVMDLTLLGAETTSCTAVVFARATLGCELSNVKINRFSVGARFYGAWYSRCNGVIFENNDVNCYADYETNDFQFLNCKFISNPAAQSLLHLEFQGNGTCRGVSLIGCSFDGMPQSFGCYFKGVNSLSFSGSTYAEVYASDGVKTGNFFRFGTGCVGVDFSNVNMIAGAGYSGTWVQCGLSAGNGANTMVIDKCFQYNAGANTSVAVDTTHGLNIAFGVNRFEKSIVIPDVAAIVPTVASTAYIPAKSGTDEIKVPICITKSTASIPVTRIRLKVLTAGTTTATQYMRIQKTDGTVLINFPMPTTLNINATFDLTDISADGYVTTTGKTAINSALATGTQLEAYTYKVGASHNWPDFSVLVEQL